MCLKLRFFVIPAACAVVASATSAQPIPMTITDRGANLSRLVQILDLSNDQVEVVGAILDEYRKRAECDAWPRMRAYSDALHSVEETQRLLVERISTGEVAPQDVPDLVPAYRKAYRLLPDAFEAVREVDEWFFTEIGAILTEDQVQEMDRARLYRLRMMYRNATVPEADVDLVELVATLERWLPPERIDVLHEWERDYGRALAALHKRTADNWGRWRLIWHEGYQFHLMSLADCEQARLAGEEPPTAQSILWDREYAEFGERAGRLAVGPYRDVANLNRANLVRLEELLDEESFRRLHSLYYETAYPGVYPDATSAAGLYTFVLEMEDLTEDQRSIVQNLFANFEAQHEALSRQMRESVFERVLGGLRQETDPDVTIGERWRELRELSDRRHELNRRQERGLLGVLSPEQFEAAADGPWDDANPPRPWDPQDRRRNRRGHGG